MNHKKTIKFYKRKAKAQEYRSAWLRSELNLADEMHHDELEELAKANRTHWLTPFAIVALFVIAYGINERLSIVEGLTINNMSCELMKDKPRFIFLRCLKNSQEQEDEQ